MKPLLILVFLCTIWLYGCGTKPGSSKTEQMKPKNVTYQIETEKMLAQGFNKGILKASKNNECPYILTVGKYSDTLDPVNLEDFFEENIPTEVWVKYSSLRMANRCSDARPVSIQAIKKR